MSWRMSLARPLSVNDRPRPLRTLRDAGDYLHTAFPGVTHDEALAATVELLMTAATTGRPANVVDATDQLESYLYAQRRIRAVARAKGGPKRIATELRRRLDGNV